MFTGFCVLTVILCGAQLTKEEDNILVKNTESMNVVKRIYRSTDYEVPEECRDKNYCTIKPPDYPEEQFNEMFKGAKVISQPTPVNDNLAGRSGDPDLVDDCQTKVTFEPLYTVRSKQGEWRTVVQAPEQNYVQKVRLETCQEVGSSCFQFLGSMIDVTTMCKQKYAVWEFLVSDGNSGTEKISVELPICCSCNYRINDRK